MFIQHQISLANKHIVHVAWVYPSACNERLPTPPSTVYSTHDGKKHK